jgi:DNA-binding PadR family transcriptional regulator
MFVAATRFARREDTAVELNRLDTIMLSLLVGGDRTGYDIIKWIERNGTYVGYTTKASQVYRQLSRMESAGWATARAEARDGVPDAKLYSITATGREMLDGWIDSPYEPSPRPLDADFQVRLMFSARRGPEKFLELVRTELDYRKKNEVFRRGDDPLLIPHNADARTREWMAEASRLQSDRGHYMVANLIAWLESAEAHLEAIVRTRAASPAAP